MTFEASHAANPPREFAYELTDADKKRFRHYEPKSAQSVLHVEAQETAFLQACIAFDRDGDFDHSDGNEPFTAFAKDFGRLNLTWLSSRIAEVLYERNEIDERMLDRINGDV